MTGKALIANVISSLVLLILSFVDYFTSYEIGLFVFYFIPVSISAWFAGKRSGIIIACLSAICWYIADFYTHHPYSTAYLIYWETFIRLISFLTTSLTIAKIKQLKVNEGYLKTELEKVLGELSRVKDDT
jgi:K+-sensing histidine kinase KdpD